MCELFLGTWKLISSENFDSYMEELAHSWNPSPKVRELRCAEVGWQTDHNKESAGGWEDGCGWFNFFSLTPSSEH
uniref:Cytosolic fatty-acid binding proteins domain-containing protein n=1 Tax=Gopherus evgoodei TaxID=1825980 RepID=A0A8C4VCW1_9SAUR